MLSFVHFSGMLYGFTLLERVKKHEWITVVQQEQKPLIGQGQAMFQVPMANGPSSGTDEVTQLKYLVPTYVVQQQDVDVDV
jgi:hypothetical protein